MERPQQYALDRFLVVLLAAALFSPVTHGLSAHVAERAGFGETLLPAENAGHPEGSPANCMLCLASSQLRATLEHGVDERLHPASHPADAKGLQTGWNPHVQVSVGGPRAPPDFL